MIFLQIVSIFLFSLVLIKAADQVVIAVHRLSKNSSSLTFVISALFLAVATSLPELFVGITSAIDGVSALSLGNIIGANIANMALVGGVATLIVGGVNIHNKFIRREMLIAGVAGIIPFFLAFIDGELGRVDGLILILIYFAYSLSFFKERFLQISNNIRSGHFPYRIFRNITHIDSQKTKETGRFFIGVAAMLFSANAVIAVAENVATNLGVSIFVIGFVLVSICTTLPELVFSVRALKEGEPVMFLGNVLGSIIVNSTLIIGIAVFISPITSLALNKYLLALSGFVITFVLLWIFIKSKMRLDRSEAVVLVVLYLIFVILEFI